MYLHTSGSGRVPAPRVEDSATHVDQSAADRQVPALHLSDEHPHHRAGGRHHQPQLPDSTDTHHAALGARCLPRRLVFHLTERVARKMGPVVVQL